MKKNIGGLAIIILLVILGIVWVSQRGSRLSDSNTPVSQNQATSTPPTQTSSLNSYKSPDKYGFSIKYPDGFGFSTDLKQVSGVSYIPVCDQYMVACMYLI